MSEIEAKLRPNKCERCNWIFGPKEPASWMQVTHKGKTVFQIWCVLCIEDVETGGNLDWTTFTGFRCDDCKGFATVERAQEYAWTIDPSGEGVFCSWCGMIRDGEADEMLPLSCLPKSQEEQDQIKSKGGINIWVQGSVLMGLLISTGMNWRVSALLLGLLYTGMVIWRHFGCTISANLPRLKQRAPK